MTRLFDFQPGRLSPAGALNKRITLQSRSAGQNSVGDPIGTWVDVATVWAYLHPLAGRELVNAQAVHAEVTHAIVVRWQAALSDPIALAAMRAVFHGRNFNILGAVNVEEASVWWILNVSEGLTDG